MNIDFSLPTVAKYAGAFVVGFLGRAVVEPFLQGVLPHQPDLLIGIGYGFLATGLFHQIPPRAEAAVAAADASKS